MQNDVLLQGLLQAGNIRLSAISGRAMVEQARRVHGLSRVCTAALGRQLMMTALMAADLKHETDSLTTILKGDGPASPLVCTGRYGALVKGYAAHPALELPPTPAGKLDVAGAVGRAGRLTVVRDLSLRKPYVGECALVSGEIAEDFAQYYALSEQTPSLVYLGVRVRPDTGEVRAAGGVRIQPLPGCPDGDIELLQARAGEITALALRLERGEPLALALQAVLGAGLSLQIERTLTPEWRCDCSRERTERALIALGREELTDMLEQDGGAELTCHFCLKQYAFTAQDLRALLREAQSPGLQETRDAQ